LDFFFFGKTKAAFIRSDPILINDPAKYSAEITPVFRSSFQTC